MDSRAGGARPWALCRGPDTMRCSISLLAAVALGGLSPGTETSSKPAACDCASNMNHCFMTAYYVFAPCEGLRGTEGAV